MTCAGLYEVWRLQIVTDDGFMEVMRQKKTRSSRVFEDVLMLFFWLHRHNRLMTREYVEKSTQVDRACTRCSRPHENTSKDVALRSAHLQCRAA